MKLLAWLRAHWKELAIPLALAALTALFSFLFWARGVILLQGHMIEDGKEQNEDLQDQVKTLKLWAGCQERQEITGKNHKFNWPTLECIEQAGNAPVNPVP
jgi:hypothetical protein